MAMNFPKLDEALRLERLTPPTDKVRMVLDTDTYNEIDDQFAVVQALLSPDQLAVEAIYAAPFYNIRSSGRATAWRKATRKSCGYWSGWILRRRAWRSGERRMCCGTTHRRSARRSMT